MIVHRVRRSPLVLVGLALLLLVALAACKSNAQLEAERTAENGTPVPTATAETTALPDATGTPTTTAGTSTEPAIRYVTNTGGTGVSLRSDCRSDARIAGAWAEGTRVEVVRVGTGSCDGWTLAESGSTETWVNNSYLGTTTVSTRPGGSTPSGTPSGGTPGTTPPPTATTQPPAASSVPGQFSIERWWFTTGSIGQKVLHLTVHNDSFEAIDQYQVDICMIDAQGHQIKEHGHGFSCFRWSDLEVHISAGASYTPDREWPLHAYEGVTHVLITPVFSHTTADNFWRP